MNLIFTNKVAEAIDRYVAQLGSPKVFTLVDDNTRQLVLPLLSSMSKAVGGSQVITIQPGDVHKGLDSLSRIWQALSDGGATRGSVVINVGGGMVTDIGGFASATFKRGIKFVNVPTTLLGAVDASVGGKTGINFNGLKNEVGAFADAETVIISAIYFNSLTRQELLSGYAEMLKHGLLDDRETLARLLTYNLDNNADHDGMLALVEQSVGYKKKIVEQDPHEEGLRRALNLGHTAGHAFESMAMSNGNPIPHGYAVAWGLVVELILSNLRLGFPAETLRQVTDFVKSHYGNFSFTCDDYPALLGYMSHDKKNPSPDNINFTLLSDVGDIHIDQICSVDEIRNALDIFRDSFE